MFWLGYFCSLVFVGLLSIEAHASSVGTVLSVAGAGFAWTLVATTVEWRKR